MEYQKLKLAAAAVLLLAVAGCSTNVAREATDAPAAQTVEQSSKVAEVAAEESNVVCYHEKKIGSNRKSLRCMSKAERDKMREVSQEAWLRQQQGSETGGG